MKYHKPTIQEIINQLQQVLADTKSREEVSNWAEESSKVFHEDSTLNDDDLSLWKMLDIVMGIDLKDSPTEYLHNEEDIKGWITRFNEKLKI